MFQKIFRLFSSVFHWYKKPFRFNLRLEIHKRANLFIGRKSSLPCPIFVSADAILNIGGNFRISKNSSIAVRDSKSQLIIEDNVSIGANSSLSVSSGYTLKIGKGTSIYSNAIFSGDIQIGEDCLFGPNVTLLSTTHVFEGRERIRKLDEMYFKKNGHPKNHPIKVGNDCWFGVNSVVLPGVELGVGCVIGANSVVTKNFPDYSILGGVPAKILKKRV